MLRRLTGRGLLAVCVLLALAGCGARAGGGLAVIAMLDVQHIARDAGSLDLNGVARIERGMGHAGIALAQRFDPSPHPDLWGRSQASLGLDSAPTLPFGLDAQDAAALNAAMPSDDADFAPAQPFVLVASPAERERALLCMTQAIYYEAATEPIEGQRAVAQTILNRVRHPDFPKSVCGVVYQGSSQAIGCQFTFTCDGSLARQPAEPYWGQARAVAEAALDGYVEPEIGSATHYHADYVFPSWGPQMVKIIQLGAHIFYRFPGPAGSPDILTGRYAGGELAVSMTGAPPDVIAAVKAEELAASAQAPNAVLPLPGAPTMPTLAALETTPAAVPLVTPTASPAEPRAAPPEVIATRAPAKQEIAHVEARPTPAAEDDGPLMTAGGDSRPPPQ